MPAVTIAAFGRRSIPLDAAGYAIEVPLELVSIAIVFGVRSAHATGFHSMFLYVALIQALANWPLRLTIS